MSDSIDDRGAPTATRSVRALISGRVQGVGYRDWTHRVATALGLDGWVRNRADGRVEAVFTGPAETIDVMLGRCRRGPMAARVTSVEVEPAEPAEAGFRVLPSA